MEKPEWIYSLGRSHGKLKLAAQTPLEGVVDETKERVHWRNIWEWVGDKDKALSRFFSN